MADIPWQSADHLSAGTGAAQFQMPWCGVPRQWAQCWAIIPCVSRDWPPIWRGPLVCIHATLRSIIRWACQFPTQCYLDAINTVHHSCSYLPSYHPSNWLQSWVDGLLCAKWYLFVFNQNGRNSYANIPDDSTLVLFLDVFSVENLANYTSACIFVYSHIYCSLSLCLSLS